ncbi:MAG TPA: SprT family zinc-dependent metalloprotease [Alphaproteobacteria bacterium]|jgi:predicted metal-dependent hydrolase|nr:SprT family zinc-dependent metalloprotease [Alphaproteobacteria bacterium]
MKKASPRNQRALMVVPADGRDVPILTRRDRRARRMTLRIDAANDRAVLVLPTWVPMSEGLRFVRTKARWMKEKLDSLPPRERFEDGARFTLFGSPLIIRYRADLGSTVVRDGPSLFVGGPKDRVAQRVQTWLKAEAKSRLAERAQAMADRLGKTVRRVSVRDSRTRWGSCAADGSLSFSWRLALAPEDVSTYVVAHEVAHLVAMNHGPKFWRTVEDLLPDHGDAKAWLSDHGVRLLRHG